MKNSGRIIVLIIFTLFLFLNINQLSAEVTNDDCIGCHSDKDIEAETERGKTLKLIVTNETMKGSVHEDLACLDVDPSHGAFGMATGGLTEPGDAVDHK